MFAGTALGVGLAAAIILLLAGLAIAQAIELRRIRQERDRADRITEFMTDMFKVSDPSQARGNDIRVREVLDKASSQVLSGLDKDPQDQAQLMEVMGDVYKNLGLSRRQSHLLRPALATRTKLLGEKNEDTLKIDGQHGRPAAIGKPHRRSRKAVTSNSRSTPSLSRPRSPRHGSIDEPAGAHPEPTRAVTPKPKRCIAQRWPLRAGNLERTIQLP